MCKADAVMASELVELLKRHIAAHGDKPVVVSVFWNDAMLLSPFHSLAKRQKVLPGNDNTMAQLVLRGQHPEEES